MLSWLPSTTRTLADSGREKLPDAGIHATYRVVRPECNQSCSNPEDGEGCEDYALANRDEKVRVIWCTDASFLAEELGCSCPFDIEDDDEKHRAEKIKFTEQLADLPLSRLFRFRTEGQLREVEIKYERGIWHILVDGVFQKSLARSERHTKTAKENHMMFKVAMADGSFLVASVTIELEGVEMITDVFTEWGVCRDPTSLPWAQWRYKLVVNNVRVKACWTEMEGELRRVCIPEVVYVDDAITRSALPIARSPVDILPSRLFRFRTAGQLREVGIKHERKVCHILVDGVLQKSESHGHRHTRTAEGKRMIFKVAMVDGSFLEASVAIQWRLHRHRTSAWAQWSYKLFVNDVLVPACWTKRVQDTPPWCIPEVVVYVDDVITRSATPIARSPVVMAGGLPAESERSLSSGVSDTTVDIDSFLDAMMGSGAEEVPHISGTHVARTAVTRQILDESTSTHGMSQPQLFERLAAYASGESVEYYSCKHRRWISGIVRVAAKGSCPEGGSDCRAAYYYNVEVGARRQLRYDVPLESIRPPLRGGEPVEIFSLRNSGEWLPAHMADNQPAGSMKHGYRVQLVGAHEVLEQILPMRIRRRFPAGSLVEVYRGLPLGWVLARVHPLAGSVQSTEQNSITDECSRQLWTLVPLAAVEEDERGQGTNEVDTPELVPSYLVRMQGTI